MNFFQRIFGIKKAIFSFENAPCLAHWYIGKNHPKLYKNSKILNWNFINMLNDKYIGATILESDQGTCYGFIKMYTYILPSDDGRSFLIWSRKMINDNGIQSIDIHHYSVDLLKSVDKSEAIKKFKDTELSVLFNAEPDSSLCLNIDPSKEEMKLQFPDDFKKFSGFIVVADIDNLYSDSDEKKQWYTTTMLEFKPNENTVYNYPQDWFNKSECDFGYQWITSALRDPRTNRIHGQGIRISDFILNETNKERID